MIGLPSLVRDTLGEDLVTAINSTFDRMEIAEEEIAAAKKSAPRAEVAIHSALCLLVPNAFLRGGDELYRLHVREILKRVKLGRDVVPGTDAEVAFALGETTLKAPPGQDLARAYFIVFERLFPEKAKGLRLPEVDYVPGRPLEIIAEARRKIGALVGRTNAQLEDSIKLTRARRRARTERATR